jgi:hypothetical protein
MSNSPQRGGFIAGLGDCYISKPYNTSFILIIICIAPTPYHNESAFMLKLGHIYMLLHYT